MPWISAQFPSLGKVSASAKLLPSARNSFVKQFTRYSFMKISTPPQTIPCDAGWV